MKNLKNMVAVIISIVSMITLLTTQWVFSVGAPNVEINNHQTSGPDTVRFIITDVNTNREVANPYVKRNAQWNDNGMIDISHKLRFEVWSSPTDHRAFMINPAQGKKTIYLSWDPAKSSPLYPQTGAWGGFSGKTDSGFPLDKKTNVEASQIALTTIPLSISAPIIQTTSVSLGEQELGRAKMPAYQSTSLGAQELGKAKIQSVSLPATEIGSAQMPYTPNQTVSLGAKQLGAAKISTPPVMTPALKELETGRSSLTNEMPTSFTSTVGKQSASLGAQELGGAKMSQLQYASLGARELGSAQFLNFNEREVQFINQSKQKGMTYRDIKDDWMMNAVKTILNGQLTNQNYNDTLQKLKGITDAVVGVPLRKDMTITNEQYAQIVLVLEKKAEAFMNKLHVGTFYPAPY